MSDVELAEVESFQLDHTKVRAPYVRKIAVEHGPKGDAITNYDIRLVQPNEGEIPTAGLHTIEHTIAGLLDGRRSLDHPPCVFAPVQYDAEEGLRLRSTYRRVLAGKQVLIADDVRNTGKTFAHVAELVTKAGGEVIGTVQIYDRMASVVTLDVPNFALLEYDARDIYTSTTCPQCAARVPTTSISVRRFFARPSDVLLLAIGFLNDLPSV